MILSLIFKNKEWLLKYDTITIKYMIYEQIRNSLFYIIWYEWTDTDTHIFAVFVLYISKRFIQKSVFIIWENISKFL